jgi:hypothetical protein
VRSASTTGKIIIHPNHPIRYRSCYWYYSCYYYSSYAAPIYYDPYAYTAYSAFDTSFTGSYLGAPIGLEEDAVKQANIRGKFNSARKGKGDHIKVLRDPDNSDAVLVVIIDKKKVDWDTLEALDDTTAV